MKALLIIFLTLILVDTYAQKPKFADKEFYLIDSLVLENLSKSDINIIDSCLFIYHNSKTDSIKWRLLSGIIENIQSDVWYEYQKIASCITEENLSKNLTKKEKKVFLKFKASDLNNTGVWLSDKGKKTEAIILYEEAILIQKKIAKNKELVSMLGNLAYSLSDIGKNQEAINIFEESILLSKKLESSQSPELLAQLAKLYLDLDQYDTGLKLINESLQLLDSSNSRKERATLYAYLGSFLGKKEENHEKALYYLKKSLVLNKQNKNKISIATSYINLGNFHQRKGNDSLALNYYNSGLKIHQEIKSPKGICAVFIGLSQIYLSQKKIDSAYLFSRKAYSIATKINNPFLIKSSSKILSKTYELKSNYKKAFFYFKKAEKMKDSLNNKENTFALAKTEAKLHYEKEKELENIKHLSELKIKEKEAEKQALYKQFFIVGSILLIIILSIIIKQLLKSNKQKRTIQVSNLKLEEQHKEITSSITYAKRIQNAILPPLELINKELSDSFVYYQPKDIVSGDFYWMEKTKNKLHFAVADCTGHGVPGAMVSVICNNGLNRSVREHQLDTPNKILDKTREIVIKEFEKSGEDIKDGMDISLVSIDFKNNVFEFSGAHNSAWVVRKAAETFELIELKGDKQPIGNFERAFPFTKKDFSIQKGDILFLSSDGYADQFGGEKNKKIKNTNFKKLLIKNAHLELEKQHSILKTFFDEWKGDNEQLDDVCVVGVKF